LRIDSILFEWGINSLEKYSSWQASLKKKKKKMDNRMTKLNNIDAEKTMEYLGKSMTKKQNQMKKRSNQRRNHSKPRQAE